MIVAINFEGKILLFNKKSEKVTGYSRHEVLGKDLIKLMIHEDRQKDLNDLLATYKKDRAIPLMDSQLPLVTKDNRVLLTSWNANPLRDYEGRIIGLIGVGHDITAMKRLEERLMVSEKLRTLGELASGVAHHFNNLLSIILRRTELIEKQLAEKGITLPDLEVIRRVSLDGAETVKRIQNFGRQEQPNTFEGIDINELLKEVIEITSSKWRDDCLKAGIRIQVHGKFDSLPPVLGHSADLKELFTNLILNAVDAMPKGGVITIETKREKDLVAIYCRDEGIGIDEETKKRIFDPFFTTKGMEGNGLGLSIAYDIVRRHRGDISVDSSPAQGTTFKVEFPMQKSFDLGASLQNSKPVSEFSPQHILLIDDEKDYRDSTAELLRSYGHQVDTACNGREALGKINQGRPIDVVLSDLTIPDISGWEIIDRIKSLRKKTKIIVISGHGGFLIKEDISKRGIDAVLSKPCTVEEVQQAIQKVLQV